MHPGHIQGYASLFNLTDKHRDTVLPGAFHRSLRAWQIFNRQPKMLWQHQTSEPIGIWTQIREDAKGLHVQGQLNLNTQRGAEAQALLKQGALDNLSIGYRTIKSRWNPRAQTRELLDLELLEISLVTMGCNPWARASSL